MDGGCRRSRAARVRQREAADEVSGGTVELQRRLLLHLPALISPLPPLPPFIPVLSLPLTAALVVWRKANKKSRNRPNGKEKQARSGSLPNNNRRSSVAQAERQGQ